jgi:hypothetical protein
MPDRAPGFNRDYPTVERMVEYLAFRVWVSQIIYRGAALYGYDERHKAN